MKCSEDGGPLWGAASAGPPLPLPEPPAQLRKPGMTRDDLFKARAVPLPLGFWPWAVLNSKGERGHCQRHCGSLRKVLLGPYRYSGIQLQQPAIPVSGLLDFSLCSSCNLGSRKPELLGSIARYISIPCKKTHKLCKRMYLLRETERNRPRGLQVPRSAEVSAASIRYVEVRMPCWEWSSTR